MIRLMTTMAGAMILAVALGVSAPATADTAATTKSTAPVQIAAGHKKIKFPKDVAARKKAFKAMSKGMKGIKKASKTKNKKLLVASANRVAKSAAFLHKNIDTLFSKKTAKVNGTRAKKAIWKKGQWPKFKASMGKLQKTSARLVKAAATGKGVGKAFKAVGKTCKSCHKPFQKKKKM